MNSPPRSKTAPPLSKETQQRLSDFAALILEWNQRINLTGFRTIAEIEQVLIGECVQALPYLEIAGKTVLDFGSGAGIPGLVWAVCQPTVRLTSLEVRQKKVAFQKEAARELQIPSEIICGRFPEAVAGRKFDVIVSRAIRFSPTLWKDARGLLNAGGLIARFASHGDPEEGWESISISDRSALLISRA